MSYIEIHRAGCLRLLRRPKQAVIHFNEALPALPSVYRRGRAAALAGKAAAHQRKSFCVKLLVGASAVVCPCIAVMGLVPSNV
jgi:hypothetical protein